MSIKVVPVFESLPEGYYVTHRELSGGGYLKPAWESFLWFQQHRVKTVVGASREGNHVRLLDWLRAQEN